MLAACCSVCTVCALESYVRWLRGAILRASCFLSLTKDMTGKDDNYRGPAVRALCQITDVSAAFPMGQLCALHFFLLYPIALSTLLFILLHPLSHSEQLSHISCCFPFPAEYHVAGH